MIKETLIVKQILLQYLRKRIEKNMENMDADVRVYRVKTGNRWSTSAYKTPYRRLLTLQAGFRSSFRLTVPPGVPWLPFSLGAMAYNTNGSR